MGDWPRFFHAHNRPATGTVHPNVLWGWNVLSRLSPSKAETTCCNCNATKGYGPGRVNTRAWAALQQVACRDPGAVRRPHRTTVAARRSVDAARATGAHIQLSEPCARATPRGLRTRPRRDGAARRLGAPYAHQTITRKRSQRIDRSSSELSRRARSLCTVRVRGSLPLLDAVSWYQVTVSGLAAGPADVRPRRAPGDQQRT